MYKLMLMIKLLTISI